MFFLHPKCVHFTHWQIKDISISRISAVTWTIFQNCRREYMGDGLSEHAIIFRPLCCMWLLLLNLDLWYKTLFLHSSTVKKMTELKSRGVKMLPSKDNQHKISVRKYQPRILHSPAAKSAICCELIKGHPRSIFYLGKIFFIWRCVYKDTQMSCDKNANDCRQSYIRKLTLSQQSPRHIRALFFCVFIFYATQ